MASISPRFLRLQELKDLVLPLFSLLSLKKKKKGKVNQKQTHRLENKFMATGENGGRENRLVVETDMHTLLYLH